MNTKTTKCLAAALSLGIGFTVAAPSAFGAIKPASDSTPVSSTDTKTSLTREQLQAAIENATNEAAQAKKNLDEKTALLNEAKKTYDKAVSELEAKQAEVKGLETQTAALLQKKEEAEKAVQVAKDKLDKAIKDSGAADELKKLEEAQKVAAKEAEEAAAAERSAQQKLEKAQQEKKLADEKVAELEKEVVSATKKIDDAKTRLSQLEQARRRGSIR